MYDENICSLFCTWLKIIVYFAVCFELVVTDDVVLRHVLGVSY